MLLTNKQTDKPMESKQPPFAKEVKIQGIWWFDAVIFTGSN